MKTQNLSFAMHVEHHSQAWQVSRAFFGLTMLRRGRQSGLQPMMKTASGRGSISRPSFAGRRTLSI